MRRPLVAGNWKMHGTCASIKQLLIELTEQALPTDVDVAVFPGLIHLQTVVAQVAQSDIVVGSQDCAVQLEEGAMTGETSAMQLKDIGCSMVIIGHSERRQLQDETDRVICRKFIAAQAAGLTPVLCVGETLEEREAGQALATVQRQVDAVLLELGVAVLENAVIAYEPIWAIGSGLTATPEQAQDIHAQIRAHVASHSVAVAQGLRILYGGSVKAANAAELFAQADIDGGLVGGASLNAKEFGAICRAAGN
ncbi:MAG TPA: triose-phosphate isomerase [Gammaproteobacteria bacterium]|nr:triose-phosphate isomerase [Gammaproteobacteria bacterium]